MKIIEGFDKVKDQYCPGRRRAGITGDDEREKTVRQIIDDVRDRGDAALFEYTEKFDGVKLTSLEVDQGGD